MAETKMSDIIRTSLEGVKEFAEKDTFIGDVIVTNAGVSIIPVSRVSIGFATGGVDYESKRLSPLQNFGGGGGTGINITPIAFLTVSPDAQVNLISLTDSGGGSAVDRVAEVIEETPKIIQKIREALF